jgi:hypothetical protein
MASHITLTQNNIQELIDKIHPAVETTDTYIYLTQCMGLVLILFDVVWIESTMNTAYCFQQCNTSFSNLIQFVYSTFLGVFNSSVIPLYGRPKLQITKDIE